MGQAKGGGRGLASLDLSLSAVMGARRTAKDATDASCDRAAKAWGRTGGHQTAGALAEGRASGVGKQAKKGRRHQSTGQGLGRDAGVAGGDGQLHAPRAEAMLDHACQPVPAHAPLCLQGCARVTFGSNHRRVWIKDTPARLRIQGRLCETHKGRVV